MAHDYSNTLRPYVNTYWGPRLFNGTCMHFDIFLYEIPTEYSAKYTHVVLIEFRLGGRKVSKVLDFVVQRMSFVEPRALRYTMHTTDVIDRSDPVRVNVKHRLETAKGRDTARWWKEYHHKLMRPMVARLAKLERAKRNSVSVRFHYFAEFDLNPARGFHNAYMQKGKGQGRKKIP